jgi:hypothetical protein
MGLGTRGSWAARCVCVALLGALGAALPATAQAKTLYLDVASKGGRCKDSYSAGQAMKAKTPWCSVKKALNAAPPGSILDLRAGTYHSVSPPDMTRSPAKLTFRSHAGETATITQIRLVSCSKLAFRRLRIKYIRIEHCSGSSFIDNEVISEGLWAFFSDDLKLVGNKLHDTDNGMILTADKRVLVENNDFRNIPRASIKGPGGDGIQAQSVSQLTLRRNVFDKFLAHEHTDSIEFAASNDHVTLDSNTFHQCRGIISVEHPVFKNAFSNTKWKIVNNEFTDMTQWAFELNNVPDARVINNTAWNTGNGMRLHGDTKGVVMANNITDFAAVEKGSQVGRSFNNVIGKIVGPYPKGASDVIGIPLFVNSSAENYQLAAGSLGINAASPSVAPKRDRLGHARVGAPDAGAFEFGGT